MIVVQNILLRNRHIALCTQVCQMRTQLLLADACARVTDAIHAKIGERNKAVILTAARGFCKGFVRPQSKKELHDANEDHRNKKDFKNSAIDFPPILLCRICRVADCIFRYILHSRLLPHPAPPTPIFACSFSCFLLSSSRSACVRRVPHVVFQNVTHATGICQSSTAS